ncbi:MAG: 6-phosphogluconolactonase [Sideroxydans sp.]
MSVFVLPHAARLIVCTDAEALAAAVAQRIAALVEQTLAIRPVCRIALAGGDTPRRCYTLLRELPLPWSRLDFYFGDERCLPVGDAERNDTMACASLLPTALPARFHPIPAERGAQAAAADYAGLLGDVTLDLVLLGMGEDGHTASLFPGNPALQLVAPVVPVFNAPKPPSERVSLSLATLNAARHKLFLVAGRGKRQALQRIARGEHLPAAQVLDAEWYLDHAAMPNE